MLYSKIISQDHFCLFIFLVDIDQYSLYISPVSYFYSYSPNLPNLPILLKLDLAKFRSFIKSIESFKYNLYFSKESYFLHFLQITCR